MKKNDSGVHLEHVNVTPGNTEYTEYGPPGAQVSRDVLATKIPFVHSFLLVKL